MSRTAPGLQQALSDIRALRDEYWKDVTVTGSADDLNQSLEKAGLVAVERIDAHQFGELEEIGGASLWRSLPR